MDNYKGLDIEAEVKEPKKRKTIKCSRWAMGIIILVLLLVLSVLLGEFLWVKLRKIKEEEYRIGKKIDEIERELTDEDLAQPLDEGENEDITDYDYSGEEYEYISEEYVDYYERTEGIGREMYYEMYPEARYGYYDPYDYEDEDDEAEIQTEHLADMESESENEREDNGRNEDIAEYDYKGEEYEYSGDDKVDFYKRTEGLGSPSTTLKPGIGIDEYERQENGGKDDIAEYDYKGEENEYSGDDNVDFYERNEGLGSPSTTLQPGIGIDEYEHEDNETRGDSGENFSNYYERNGNMTSDLNKEQELEMWDYDDIEIYNESSTNLLPSLTPKPASAINPTDRSVYVVEMIPSSDKYQMCRYEHSGNLIFCFAIDHEPMVGVEVMLSGDIVIASSSQLTWYSPEGTIARVTPGFHNLSAITRDVHDQLFVVDDGPVLMVNNSGNIINVMNRSGLARDIAVASDGTIFVINNDGIVEKSDHNSTWLVLEDTKDVAMTHIDVDYINGGDDYMLVMVEERCECVQIRDSKYYPTPFVVGHGRYCRDGSVC